MRATKQSLAVALVVALMLVMGACKDSKLLAPETARSWSTSRRAIR